uniref:hypothetical protein n=1 Tax=Streptococcus mutans TaxID=1309 RepID=UPI00081C0E74|nr:hypothetical protein [Streptococcus mutans]
MLKIGNKLINKVNVDGQELTFTLIDFSDNEISGKISVQGDFTQADDYKTNNQILETLKSKNWVDQRTMTRLTLNTNINGLTLVQQELAKKICFVSDFPDKKTFVQLLPAFSKTVDFNTGKIVWEKYDDNYGLFYLNKSIKAGQVNTLVDNTEYADPLWGSDYDGTYF